MITHFAADGSVKRQWPEGLHASVFDLGGKTFAQIQGSNSVARVELEAGDQVGETFTSEPLASAAPETVEIIKDAQANLPADDPSHEEPKFHSTIQAAAEAFHASQGTTPPPDEPQTIAEAEAQLNDPEPVFPGPTPQEVTAALADLHPDAAAAAQELAHATSVSLSSEPAPVEISTTEVAALNDAIHTIQDVAAHLAHPQRAAMTEETMTKIAEGVLSHSISEIATPETHADPATSAPETPQQ